MAQPVIVQESSLRQFSAALVSVFSLPQWKYFVTVLLGLLHCDGSRTLSGVLRQVACAVTLSGLSRFLSEAPWSAQALTLARQRRFNQQVAAAVDQTHAEQRAERPLRPGRPARTVVTGYLVMDDSTHVKRYAKAMAGQGWHYSSSDGEQMPGHSLFQAVYCLLGRQLPLTPHLYRQRAVCVREEVPFQSKVKLAVQTVETFEPPPDTHTHVLVDSWYLNRQLWRASRRRTWDITGGLKANRCLRQTLPHGERVWLRVADYAATLKPTDFQPICWPNQQGGETVYGHLVRTKIKKLGAAQLLIVKPTQEAPFSQGRFWATSRLTDTLAQVVTTVAQRWTIEVLFADFKELLGSDHYQVRSAQAIVRFWALALCLYHYLDEHRCLLEQQRHAHVSLGEARTFVRQRHAELLVDWLWRQFDDGRSPDQLRPFLAPALV
jgi:hypothetical protein